MKISKRQLKAVLNVAYEAGITYTVQQQYNLDCSTQESVIKRIAKHEAKHAKMRKLKNVREHWNVAADYVVNLRGELGAELEATRQKIAEQLSMVGRSIQSIDPTLYEKEEVLEQALAEARDTAPTTLQDLLTEYKD